MKNKPNQIINPFNSAIETGLRALVLLDASPLACDLRRLSIYDYLLIHSGDIPDGPESLHPPTPYRFGELLVRREILHEGLKLMISRELIAVVFDTNGISYSSSVLSNAFIKYIASSYAQDLQDRARWVVSAFGDFSNDALTIFAMEHLRDWGGEFLNNNSTLEEGV